jgi:hypothetical protein
VLRTLTIRDSAEVIESLRVYVIENMMAASKSLDSDNKAGDDKEGFYLSDDGLEITIYSVNDYRLLIGCVLRHAEEYTIRT